MTHEEETAVVQWSKTEEDEEAVVFDDFEPEPPEWEDLIRWIKEIAAQGHLETRADAVMTWVNDVEAVSLFGFFRGVGDGRRLE